MACNQVWETIMAEDDKVMILNKAFRMSIYLIWAMLLFVAFVIGPRVEAVLYPVVPEFTVTEQFQVDGRYYVRGTMVKDRPECEPVEVNMFAGGGSTDPNSKVIYVDFSPDRFHDTTIDGLRTRPAGAQNWGPWELFPPDEPIGPVITVSVLHDCHFLWNTPSRLTITNTANVFPDKLIDE